MHRKTLLALMIIATLPVTAATDRTIYITTFDDENGENANACSLREAIKASTDNRAFGGCIAGQRDLTDQIKLKEGTYTLKSPLVIASALTITGDDAIELKDDPITNSYPARSKLKTIIKGNGTFSLFDSTTSRSSFNLNNLILKNGGGSYGGAIRAGGTVTLSRVNILDSTASSSGGAVYLEGADSSLNATDSLFQRNNAMRGAVIGMSCIDKLINTPHSITLDRTSIMENGSVSAQNIIEFCGKVNSTISASTIAKNISSDATIKYTHDEKELEYVLHPTDSSLSLTSDTIVENTSNSTLLYDNVAKLNLDNTIIAYNIGGKSCRYGVSNPKVALADMEASKISAVSVALVKPSTSTNQQSVCDLPGHLYKSDTSSSSKKFIDLSGISLSTVLTPLSSQAINSAVDSGLTPFYLPKSTGSSTVSLVDTGTVSCTATDQRGANRNISEQIGQVYTNNKCDIGSIEISQLAAADITGVSNTLYKPRIQQYQDNIAYYQGILDFKGLDEKLVKRYKELLQEDQASLAAFKSSLKYRQAYASVLANSIEQEENNGDGTTTFKKFADFDKYYNIKVWSVGRGTQQFIDTKKDSDLNSPTEADKISCKWESTLKQILIRRTDADSKTIKFAQPTPAGLFEYCKYEISLKTNPDIKSVGYVQAQIVNIAPTANSDKFYLNYGSSQSMKLDILANDNDDGDGEPGVTGYPTDRKPFFTDPETGRFANIKLVKKPQLGQLNFEYQQPCPTTSDTQSNDTCYGGEVTYKANSTFSPFTDSFVYKVIDQDKAVSNDAKVEIINTASTDSHKSGGGSLGIAGLVGLMSLAWSRRKVIIK